MLGIAYDSAVFIIVEIQAVAACFQPGQHISAVVIACGFRACGFRGTEAVFIIGIACGDAVLRDGCQLPATLPAEAHAPVAQRIAHGIIGDALAVISR